MVLRGFDRVVLCVGAVAAVDSLDAWLVGMLHLQNRTLEVYALWFAVVSHLFVGAFGHERFHRVVLCYVVDGPHGWSGFLT